MLCTWYVPITHSCIIVLPFLSRFLYTTWRGLEHLLYIYSCNYKADFHLHEIAAAKDYCTLQQSKTQSCSDLTKPVKWSMTMLSFVNHVLILTSDLSISSYCCHLFELRCTLRLTDPSKSVPDHWIKNTLCNQQFCCHKAFQSELEWRWRKCLHYSFQQAGHLHANNT